jgi:hypothetical protein
MSLQIAAKHLAAQGRGPDTTLVHMTNKEVQGLQALAEKNGGSLSINPKTGLPEAGFLESILPVVAGVGLTAAGMGPMAAALTVGGVSALSTGSLSKGLFAGLGAYGGASLGEQLAVQGMGEAAAANASFGDKLAGMGDASAFSSMKGAGEFISANKLPFMAGLAGPLLSSMEDDNQNDKPSEPEKDTDLGERARSGVKYNPGYATPTPLPNPYGIEQTYAKPYYAAEGGVAHMAEGGSTSTPIDTKTQFAEYLKKVMNPTNRSNAVSGGTNPYDWWKNPNDPAKTTPAVASGETDEEYATRTRANARGGSGAQKEDFNPEWTAKTDEEKAAWYAEHPNFAAVTQAGQNILGYTGLGMLQNKMDPGFVERQKFIAQGINPGDGSLNSTGSPSRYQSTATSAIPTGTETPYSETADAKRDITEGGNYPTADAKRDITEGGNYPTADAKGDIRRGGFDGYGIADAKGDIRRGGFDGLADNEFDAYNFDQPTPAPFDAYNFDQPTPARYQFKPNAVQDILKNFPTSDFYFGVPASAADAYLWANAEQEKAGREPLVPTRYEGVVSATDLGSQFPGPAKTTTQKQAERIKALAAESGDYTPQKDALGQLIDPQKIIDAYTKQIEKNEMYAENAKNFLSPDIPLADREANIAYFNAEADRARKQRDVFLNYGGPESQYNALKYTDPTTQDYKTPYVNYTPDIQNVDEIKATPEINPVDPYAVDSDYVSQYSPASDVAALGLGEVAALTPGIPAGTSNYFSNTPGYGLAMPNMGNRSSSGLAGIPGASGLYGGSGWGGVGVGFGGLGSYWQGVTDRDGNPVMTSQGMAEKAFRDSPEGQAMQKADMNADRESRSITRGELQGGEPQGGGWIGHDADPGDHGYGSTAATGGLSTPYGFEHMARGGNVHGNLRPPHPFFQNGKYSFHPAQMYADGGISDPYNLGSYSDGGRLLKGPGDGVSDSIPATIGKGRPARLADGEFVIPARIVSEIGNGSTDAGARKLYAMMDRIQASRGNTVGKGKVAVNNRADKYLPV